MTDTGKCSTCGATDPNALSICSNPYHIDPAEKWRAKARDIVCAEIMMSSHITGDAVAWLEAEIAAALAEAAAEGEKYGWQRGHSAAIGAIRGRSHD